MFHLKLIEVFFFIILSNMQDEILMTNGHHHTLSRSQTPEALHDVEEEHRAEPQDEPQEAPSNPEPPSQDGRVDSRRASRMLGTVKWFNVKAGYGFITRNDTGEDIFVHFSGIARKNPRHMLRSLGDGEVVEFNVIATHVTGINRRPVRGNPFVSHIPVRRTDSFASGDPALPHQRYIRVANFGNSRIPVSRFNWRQRI